MEIYAEMLEEWLEAVIIYLCIILFYLLQFSDCFGE